MWGQLGVLLCLCMLVPDSESTIALLKPVPNGMQVWWDDPVMPTAEFLLTWQKEGSNKVEGHKFVERNARNYVVKGLEDCQMYTFNLIAMDWKYRQFGAGRKSGMTGNCPSEIEEDELSIST
ncbi:hypothetical protein CRM22_008286 [Opisthorchis felineus]|uniref:Uncharacterized protein n=1 Tax=Opisthorchis felineus TaxID=147828 RepID=A0A4S2LBV6_OPIFE|nr:hypothetical protein CRM22_008286 [Opisthorchis felineus]